MCQSYYSCRIYIFKFKFSFSLHQLKIATKDFNTVKVIIDEISFYQKLNHPNIVKFYGVEIIKVHHNESALNTL